MPFSDIVHRPFQVVTPLDIALLRRLGRAVVHHPAGPDRLSQPRLLRRTTRPGTATASWRAQALASADRVVFFSGHAAGRGGQRGPGRADRARVVLHRRRPPRARAAPTPRAAAAARRSASARCCSASARTSGTRTACSRWRSSARCRRATASPAGSCSPARTPDGTSAQEEAAWLAAHASHRARVIDLGAVTRPRRRGCTRTPRSSCTRPCARASAWCRSRPRPRARRRCGRRSRRSPRCCRPRRRDRGLGRRRDRRRPPPRCWPTRRPAPASSTRCARPAPATSGTARPSRWSSSTARPRPRPARRRRLARRAVQRRRGRARGLGWLHPARRPAGAAGGLHPPLAASPGVLRPQGRVAAMYARRG